MSSLQAPPASHLTSLLESQTLRDGRSIADASDRQTLLVVFLRHLG